MFERFRKVLSILAVMMMVSASLPLNVLAEESTQPAVESTTNSEVAENKVIEPTTTTTTEATTQPSVENNQNNVSEAIGSTDNANAPNPNVETETTTTSTSETKEEAKVVTSADDQSNTQEVDMDKIARLASRPFPEVYSTKGLTNAEIEQLGLAIWGTYFEGETYMTNDKGEQVKIPYKKPRRVSRAVTSSKRIYVSYVMAGFVRQHVMSAWHTIMWTENMRTVSNQITYFTIIKAMPLCLWIFIILHTNVSMTF